MMKVLYKTILVGVNAVSLLARLSKRIGELVYFRMRVLDFKLGLKAHGGKMYDCLCYNPVVDEKQRLVIFANGPALKEDIFRLKRENIMGDCVDYFMMNYSASQDIFDEFKPKYYALADPMFFHADARIERVRKLFSDLNQKVTWSMTLFLAYDVQSFLQFSGIKNSNIKCQRILPSDTPHRGNRKFLDYKAGIAMPHLGTVANMAVYAGIQLGYKKIELCGVDMSFFDGLCINDNNETCIIERHYYDDEVTLKPYIDSQTGKAMSLDRYVGMVLRMIQSHKGLYEYGSKLGVKFINRTRNSMLDCYPRLITVNPKLF